VVKENHVCAVCVKCASVDMWAGVTIHV